MLSQLMKYNILFNLLDELISENLLEYITDKKGETFVYLTYEMFENYLIAKRIVDESIKNSNDCEELVRKVFSKESKYHVLVRKDHAKQRIMTLYKDRYSRRNTFRAELSKK